MPFGLSNAPASFQGYINKILVKKLDIFVIVYLNDILIYTKNQGRVYVEAMWWVLDFLRKNIYLLIWRNADFIKTRCNF